MLIPTTWVDIAADNLEALTEAEKAAGIEPDPHVAAFMKANTLEGKAENIHTEFILHILGLNVCADTLVSSGDSPIPADLLERCPLWCDLLISHPIKQAFCEFDYGSAAEA